MSEHVNWSYHDGLLRVWIGRGPVVTLAGREAGIVCEALSNLTMRAQAAEEARQQHTEVERPEITPGDVREWARALRGLADDMDETAEGDDL